MACRATRAARPPRPRANEPGARGRSARCDRARPPGSGRRPSEAATKVVGRGRSLPLSTGQAMLQIQRLGAGDQLPAQNRLERAGLDLDAEPGGDVLGCRVRLLRREPALLDGKVGPVAGRVHVGDALDPAVLVDRREAVRIAGQACELGAGDHRQRDDHPAQEQTLGRESNMAVLVLDRTPRGFQRNTAAREQLGDGRAGGGAEDGQSSRFRRDKSQAKIAIAELLAALAKEQCKLVEGQ